MVTAAAATAKSRKPAEVAATATAAAVGEQ